MKYLVLENSNGVWTNIVSYGGFLGLPSLTSLSSFKIVMEYGQILFHMADFLVFLH